MQELLDTAFREDELLAQLTRLGSQVDDAMASPEQVERIEEIREWIVGRRSAMEEALLTSLVPMASIEPVCTTTSREVGSAVGKLH